jgi:hypothetical protein
MESFDYVLGFKSDIITEVLELEFKDDKVHINKFLTKE